MRGVLFMGLVMAILPMALSPFPAQALVLGTPPTAQIFITNLSSSKPANVTADFYNKGGQMVETAGPLVIPPSGQDVINVADMTGLSPGETYSCRIDSDQHVSTACVLTSDNDRAIYNSPSLSNQTYITRARADFDNGWGGSIYTGNPGSGIVTTTTQVTTADGTEKVLISTNELQSMGHSETNLLNQLDPLVVTSQFSGSASVNSANDPTRSCYVEYGQYHSSAYSAATTTSKTWYIPNSTNNHYGVRSSHAIYNPGDQQANYTTTYTDNFGEQTMGASGVVPPGGTTEIQDQDYLSQGGYGGAVIQADQPVVAIGNSWNQTGGQSCYRGMPRGETTIYVPAVFNSYHSSNERTIVYIASTGNWPINLNVTVRDPNGGKIKEKRTTLSPGGTYPFDLKYATGDTPYRGSAVVSADGNIAVICNNLDGDNLASYSGKYASIAASSEYYNGVPGQ